MKVPDCRSSHIHFEKPALKGRMEGSQSQLHIGGLLLRGLVMFSTIPLINVLLSVTRFNRPYI